MQYLYQKYGRLRAGLTATVVTYRAKGAIREVGKVFGLSTDAIDAMNQMSWSWYASDLNAEKVRELGFDPKDPILAKVLTLANDLMRFPRHLSQHVGGFVLTRDRLDHYVPISNAAMENRTVIEWDKDDIDALRILKVDVLALGMLTCIKRAFDLMRDHYGKALTLAGILDEEREDQERRKRGEPCLSDRVYRMTHRADTIGVFQIESRAQMSMLPRLKPSEFYDLVIEVAIVRPGPIQGGMVHPYLKRRQQPPEERAQINYHSPRLKAVLARTLGIPLFQEQAMQMAVVGAGFSTGKADGLRRAMATWKHNGRIHEYRQDFIEGMTRNGYAEEFATRCFQQIEGFGEYGFPESHAASFALLVYVSCWLKCHYPDVFACALLNSQPMGFYAPAQIVRDAIEHGVEVRPVDVNRSGYEHGLEPGPRAAERVWDRHAEMRDDIRAENALRLGLAQVLGLKEDHARKIVERRSDGYRSVRDLWLRTGLPVAALQKLAEADAFGSMGLSRRDALWAVRGLVATDGAETLPLFEQAEAPGSREDIREDLPQMAPGEAVINDYKALTLSLKAHPVAFLRSMLASRRILKAQELSARADGSTVEVAGLVLVRQRPGTASGIIFATLEDETGIANIVIWDALFQKNRRVVLGSRMLAVRGRLQREGLVIHVIARSFTDMTPYLLEIARGHEVGPATIGKPERDEGERRRIDAARRDARAALPSGRNFH
jgi:error-prone DNA polymerase